MNNSLDQKREKQPGDVICAGGFVLRRREWADHGKECLGDECPHPPTCSIKLRNQHGDKEK